MSKAKTKADKMFKELGFFYQPKIIYDDETLLFYVKDTDYIVFCKDKTFYTHCVNKDYVTDINMELLQAINEKCKELGWFDEWRRNFRRIPTTD